MASSEKIKQPLLQPGSKRTERDKQDEEEYSLGRTVLYYFSMFLFAIAMLYASGVPLVVCSVMQQTGTLPLPEENQGFWGIMFPVSHGNFHSQNVTTPSGETVWQVDMFTNSYLAIAIPFFVASVLLEAFILRVVLLPKDRPLHNFRVNDAICSLSLGITNIMIARLIFLNWTEPLYLVVFDNIRVTSFFTDGTYWYSWWACLLVHDFLYYWWHRLSHEISWLWTDHVTHHSSEEYNLTTALRQPFVDWLAPGFLISSLPMAMLFPWQMYQLHASFSLLYQFWIHTQLIGPTPTFELVFNSPSLHRIHHARNAHRLSKNYGAIFSIWDRMFGTFMPEVIQGDTEDIYYGVIPALQSFDPVWANFHHWHHLIFVQLKWQGVLAPFLHWTPPGGKCPKLGSRMNPTTKYDVTPNVFEFELYAVMQFLIVLVFTGFFFLFGGAVFAAETQSLFASAFGIDIQDPTMLDGVASAFVFTLTLWATHSIAMVQEVTVENANSVLAGEAFRQIVTSVVAAAFIVQSVSLEVTIACTLTYCAVNLVPIGFLFCTRSSMLETHGERSKKQSQQGKKTWYPNGRVPRPVVRTLGTEEPADSLVGLISP